MKTMPVESLDDNSGMGLPIDDCNERLVECQPSVNIFVEPIYFNNGILDASSRIEVRTGVWARIKAAATKLGSEFSLVLFDGHRTLRTQKALGEMLRTDIPTHYQSEQEKVEFLGRYCMPVPTDRVGYERAPPPHSTGGAIDLVLGDATGIPLDMGADFDELSERSHIDYYEHDYGEYSEVYQMRRRILYWAMRGAGCIPYTREFWHFEFGTQRHAAFTGRDHAIYGPIIDWNEFREL